VSDIVLLGVAVVVSAAAVGAVEEVVVVAGVAFVADCDPEDVASWALLQPTVVRARAKNDIE
jgi:hypothetical protein